MFALKKRVFQRKKLQIYYSLPTNPIINTVQQKVNSLKLYNLIPGVSKVQVFQYNSNEYGTIPHFFTASI